MSRNSGFARGRRYRFDATSTLGGARRYAQRRLRFRV
jgi:hypothetical protein